MYTNAAEKHARPTWRGSATGCLPPASSSMSATNKAPMTSWVRSAYEEDDATGADYRQHDCAGLRDYDESAGEHLQLLLLRCRGSLPSSLPRQDWTPPRQDWTKTGQETFNNAFVLNQNINAGRWLGIIYMPCLGTQILRVMNRPMCHSLGTSTSNATTSAQNTETKRLVERHGI